MYSEVLVVDYSCCMVGGVRVCFLLVFKLTFNLLLSE